MNTWLITGCSTGLGRALAAEVLGRGHNAVVTARDAAAVQDLVEAHSGNALGLALDVTDADRVTEVVQRAEERFGAIDVVVNNAGYGYRAAVEEGDEADVRRLFDTNLFGPVRRGHRHYAETAGKRRKEHDTVHGTQPGDPARAAAALVDVVTSGKAPELLVLGSDALTGYRSVADAQRAEVEAWEHASTSTDFTQS